MFDKPDARRIRRIDLYHALSSPEPSEPNPALTALLHDQLSKIYGPTTNALVPPTPSEPKLSPNDPEPLKTTDVELNGSGTHKDGFEFRLFSTTSRDKSRKTLTRVILDDDAEDALARGNGAFITPHRHLKYYLTSLDPDLGNRRKQYRSVALGGEEVRSFLNVRYTGWEKPWRVTTLQASHPPSVTRKGGKAAPGQNRGHDSREDAARSITKSSTSPVPDATSMEDPPQSTAPTLDQPGSTHQPPLKSPIPLFDPNFPPKKKTKPNKKRRIFLRTRQKLADEALKRKEEERGARMRREREKRMRKNRERKVKRIRKRAVERERAGAGAGGGEGDKGEGVTGVGGGGDS